MVQNIRREDGYNPGFFEHDNDLLADILEMEYECVEQIKNTGTLEWFPYTGARFTSGSDRHRLVDKWKKKAEDWLLEHDYDLYDLADAPRLPEKAEVEYKIVWEEAK